MRRVEHDGLEFHRYSRSIHILRRGQFMAEVPVSGNQDLDSHRLLVALRGINRHRRPAAAGQRPRLALVH